MSSPDMEIDSSSASQPTPSFASLAAKQTIFKIDLRDDFSFFDVPNFDVVRKAIKKAFPDDPALVIQRLRNEMKGVIKIATTTSPITEKISLARKNIDSGMEELVSIGLVPWGEARGERREGTLITIVNAEMGAARAIPGPRFDEALSPFGEILMFCKPQKYQKSDDLNGNRMLVLKTDNIDELPNRIEVEGQSFLIKFKGKKWFCTTCKEDHIGPCEYIKRFHEIREKRKQESKVAHLISDSCLRHVEQVGLRADVSCMSGAAAGQLVLAAEQDPEGENHLGLVLAAGANDVKVGGVWTELDMAKKIEKSLGRVQELAAKSNKKVIFISTVPPLVSGSPLEHFANRYFERRIQKIADKHSNFVKLEFDQDPEKWVDGHPNEDCTQEVIKDLNDQLPDLIFAEDFLTNASIYSGVNTMWLFGCTGCRTRGRFLSGGFCTECLASMHAAKKFNSKLCMTRGLRKLWALG